MKDTMKIEFKEAGGSTQPLVLDGTSQFITNPNITNPNITSPNAGDHDSLRPAVEASADRELRLSKRIANASLEGLLVSDEDVEPLVRSVESEKAIAATEAAATELTVAPLPVTVPPSLPAKKAPCNCGCGKKAKKRKVRRVAIEL